MNPKKRCFWKKGKRVGSKGSRLKNKSRWGVQGGEQGRSVSAPGPSWPWQLSGTAATLWCCRSAARVPERQRFVWNVMVEHYVPHHWCWNIRFEHIRKSRDVYQLAQLRICYNYKKSQEIRGYHGDIPFKHKLAKERGLNWINKVKAPKRHNIV